MSVYKYELVSTRILPQKYIFKIKKGKKIFFPYVFFIKAA